MLTQGLLWLVTMLAVASCAGPEDPLVPGRGPADPQPVTIGLPGGKGGGTAIPRDLRTGGERPGELTQAITQANGILYHGGSVMQGEVHVYTIWYGNWAGNSATNILTDLAQSIGGSPYFAINRGYDDVSGSVGGAVRYAGSAFDSYSHGTVLSDAGIQAVVAQAISSAALPSDPNGVYFVLTSPGVSETSTIGSFCTNFCGWHTHGLIDAVDIKYSFIGNSAGCSLACTVQSTGPNGNAGADGMATVFAHELAETVTDPDLDAWYDNNGQENADKCAWTFGPEYTAPNGARANLALGSRNYLIQRNWVNDSGGYCDMRAPVPDIDLTPGSLAFPDTRQATVSAPIGLVVRNVGTGTLTATVTSPTADLQLACGAGACSCPSAAACTVTVGAAQQATVNVRHAPSQPGSLTATLAVTSNDLDEASLSVPVTGNATFSQANISPTWVNFGFVEVGKASTMTVSLANAGTAPLVISSLVVTGNTADYSVTPVAALPTTVASHANTSFTIRCQPTSAGYKTLGITIVSDANVQGAHVTVTVEAKAPDARVIVQSPGLDFGSQLLGSTTTRSVSVLNVSTGSNAFTFTLTRPVPPFALTCASGCTCPTPSTCTGTVTSTGNSASLTLSYTPTAGGSNAASLTFNSNAPNLPMSVMTATGVGVP